VLVAVSNIPTLSEWSMIALAGLIALFGFVRLMLAQSRERVLV
jgi:hypothetical protein